MAEKNYKFEGKAEGGKLTVREKEKEKHNQKALESIADWKWETRAFFTPTRRQGVTGLGWSRCTHIGTKS